MLGLLIASFLGSLRPQSAQAQAISFIIESARRYGSPSDDLAQALVAMENGGLMLGGTGRFGLTGGDRVSTVTGTSDFWLLRLTAAGEPVWEQSYGAYGRSELRSLLATTDGGCLVAGDTDAPSGPWPKELTRGGLDAWLLKLAADGTVQWQGTYGGYEHERVRQVLKTTDGGYLLAGTTTTVRPADEVSEPTRGASDYWLLKLSATGKRQWDHRYGGSGVEELQAIVATASGGYLLAGFSQSPPSGDRKLALKGDGDSWLVQVDAQGNKQWERSLGGDDLCLPATLLATSDGGYLLGATAYAGRSGDKSETHLGDGDYWLVKLDTQGNKQWDHRYGGTGPDLLTGLAATTSGGYVLSGASSSGPSAYKKEASRGGLDFWLIQVDSKGVMQAERTVGGRDHDEPRALLVQGEQILAAGYTSSQGNSEATTPGRGGQDYWLVRLAPGRVTSTASIASITTGTGLFYPQPMDKSGQLQLPEGIPAGLLTLQWFTLTGQQVASCSLPLQAGAHRVPISRPPLPGGAYVLRGQLPGGTFLTQRVLLAAE